MKRNQKVKYYIFLVVLLVTGMLSVGFSAFQKSLNVEDLLMHVRLQRDVRVKSKSLQASDGVIFEDDDLENYNVSKIYGNLTFDSSSSYILYKVGLVNYGNVKTGLLNINNNSSGINYSLCDSNGNNCTNDFRTAICNGSDCTLGAEKDVYLKISPTTSGDRTIDLDLDFEPYNDITYDNVRENTNSFPTEIMSTDSFTISLTSKPEEVEVSGTAEVEYNKNTGVLTVSNIGSDLSITAKYLLTTVAQTSYTGSDPDNYVKLGNDLYRIITKENIDDGYNNTELRTKILSNTSIGSYPFDTYDNGNFDESSLYEVLNTTYYNSLSNTQKELIDTSRWFFTNNWEDPAEPDANKYYFVSHFALITASDFNNNSSWLNQDQFMMDICYGIGANTFVCTIENNTISQTQISNQDDVYPVTYLKTDVLVVGGSGTQADPYLLELSSNGLQSNPTHIEGRNLTVTGSSQQLVTVTNSVGTPYYSTSTALNSSNYSSAGSTTIPTASEVGNYTVYYYIPAFENIKAKSGAVSSRISGIKYTISYAKGTNVSAIGKTSDECTTSGANLSCSVTLPSITPNAGYSNGKWSDGTNTYNPGTSYTLSGNGTTLTAQVSGNIYTATFHYYNGSAIATKTAQCAVSSGSSCSVTVPTEVSSSSGKYTGTYRGVNTSFSAMSTSGLVLSDDTTFYANYSSAVTNYYFNGTQYTSRTLYRNEYFTAVDTISASLATSQTSIVNVNMATPNGPGSSTWYGLSTAQDIDIEYESVEEAATSTSTRLYSVYEFSATFAAGTGVESVSSETGSCKVTTSNTSCAITPPTATLQSGYMNPIWTQSGTGTTYAISDPITVNTNNNTYTASAIAANYQNTTTNATYTSLNEAFSAVANNQTIKVLQDTNETAGATLASGNTGVKLDLNGKNIQFESISDHITINGSIEITGDGTISSNESLQNNGSVTVSNGAAVSADNYGIINDGTLIINNASVGSYDASGIDNNGNVTINNGQVSGYGSGVSSSGTLTINGGTIGAITGIILENGGQLYLNDGNVSGRTAAISIDTGATANITGGSINSSGSGSAVGISNYGTLYFSGGNISFTNNTDIYSYGIKNYGTANISGGSISITGSKLNSSPYGIYNEGSLSVSGGSISTTTIGVAGNSYGIYSKSNSVTIGTNDSTVSTTVPVIESKIGNTYNGYGLYVANGTFNFYDGIIKAESGSGYAINRDPDNVPTGYHVVKSLSSGVESAYLEQLKYTATFYYYNGSAIDTKTSECIVTSGNSCAVSVPSEVSSSTGQYGSSYANVSRSTNSLTAGSLTITENTTFYAYYSSALTIYYPNTSNGVSSSNSALYRNEYYSSSSAMTTITATSQTSTTQATSITLNNLKGTLQGINSTVNSTTYYAINSDTIKNSNTKTYYAVTTGSENATFHYNSNTTSGSFTDATATSSVTSTYYCSSTSAMGTSHGTTTTVPSSVSSSVGKYNSAYKGVSISNNGITNATTFNGGSTYYAYYSSALTIYYPNTSNGVSSSNSALYRNEYYNSSSAMTTITATSQTSTTQASSITLNNLKGTLQGINSTVNRPTYYAINSDTIKNSNTTTYYAVTTMSEDVTFHYNSNTTSGQFTDAIATESVTSYCFCKNTTTATVSHNSIASVPSVVTGSVGKYNSAYKGVSSSSTGITNATTFTGGSTYYAYYSSALTIYYPNTSNGVSNSSTALYRNEYYDYYSSTQEPKMTVITATSQTAYIQSTPATVTLSNIKGTFVGLNTTVNSNSYTAINDNAIKNSATTTYYAVTTFSENATFHYNSNTTSGSFTDATTAQSVSSRYYCASTTAMGTLHGTTTTVPTAVSNSVGKFNSPYKGISSSSSNISNITTFTGGQTYYAYYSQPLTIYYPNTSNGVSSTSTALYRNEYYNSGSTITSKTAISQDSITQATESDVVLSNILGRLIGLNSVVNNNSSSPVSSNYLLNSSGKTYYAVTSFGENATFHYNSNTTSGSFTDATATQAIISKYYCASSSTIGTTHGTTTSVPTAVSNSVGKYNSPYKGISSSSTGITNVTTFTGGQTYYAYYSGPVTNYYYNGTQYTNRTLYRNEYYSASNAMSAKLSTSQTSIANINVDDETGPRGAEWYGLSSGQDTNIEYEDVQEAADSNSTSLYTVYEFSATFAAGANITAVSPTHRECYVTYNSTSCSVLPPTVTPASGYMASAWIQSGTGTSFAISDPIIIDTMGYTYTATAVSSNYQNTTTNIVYSKLNDAFNAVSNNQTIIVLKDVNENTTATLPSSKTGIKLDMNGKNITFSSTTDLVNNGSLEIMSSSNTPSVLTGNYDRTIVNNGTLLLNANSTSQITINNNYLATPSSSLIITIENYGNLTINNGYITISETGPLGVAVSGTTTMNGGEIYSQGSAFGGNLTMSGGKITSESTGDLPLQIQELNMTGGEIIANHIEIDEEGNISGTAIVPNIHCYASNDEVHLNISGGTINGSIIFDDMENDYYVNITGGTINGLIENGDDSISHVTINGNAVINGGLDVTYLTMGVNDSTVNISYPLIEGDSAYYTITADVFNFYDGLIKSHAGSGHTFTSAPDDIPSGYYVKKELNSGVESAYLAKNPTAKFYYWDGTNIATKSVTCSITNGTSCSVTVPSEVSSSTGKFGGSYKGVSTSTSNMSSGNLTINADTNFYAYYNRQMTIYYPNSTTTQTSTTYYRNEFFTSINQIGAVLSNTNNGTSNITFTSIPNGYNLYGFAQNYGTSERYYSNIEQLAESSATTAYAIFDKTANATVYYNTGSNGTVSIASRTTNTVVQYLRCTANGAEPYGNNFTIPNVVSNSLGPNGEAYRGVSGSLNSMTTISPTNDHTVFYAVYAQAITNYYYNNNYTIRTLYRNCYFDSNTSMKAVLAPSNTSASNYTTASGPGGSVWAGLSPTADATVDYSTIDAAANSNNNTLYTVYTFNVTFAAGTGISSVSSSTGSCNVTTSDTSCEITPPSVTPNSGYIAKNWTESGTSNTYGINENIPVSTNGKTYTANAVSANYINTSTNTYYETLNAAFRDVSSNQIIKALNDVEETTSVSMASNHTNIKFDLNGHTITISTGNQVGVNICSTCELDIYSSSGTGSFLGNTTSFINVSGTLTVNGASTANPVIIRKIATDSGGYTISNGSNYSGGVTGTTTINANATISSVGSNCIINNNGTVTINNATITAGYFGILNHEDGITNINGDNTSVSALGEYGSAISSNGTITISGGHFSSSNYHGLRIDGGIATITSGVITGTWDGIQIESGTLNLGVNDSTVSNSDPLIQTMATSNYYGINAKSGSTFNFYDGVIKSSSGSGYAINTNPDNVSSGYAVVKSVSSGIETAVLGRPITATFHYNSNTTRGSFTDATTTQTCYLIGSNTSCTIEVPSVVTSSVGRYNSPFSGVATSINSVTNAIENVSGVQKVSISSSTSLYAFYTDNSTTNILIYRNASGDACSSIAYYRNDYYDTSTTMKSIIATSQNNMTAATITSSLSGYTLVGFNDFDNSNVTNIRNTTSNLIETTYHELYMLLKKDKTVHIYYNTYDSNNPGVVNINSINKLVSNYVYCQSRTNRGTLNPDTALTTAEKNLVINSKSKWGQAYAGSTTVMPFAHSLNSMTTTTEGISYKYDNYYAVYFNSVSIWQYNTSSGAWEKNTTSYVRNSFYTSTTTMKDVFATSITSTTNYTPTTGPGGSVFAGLSVQWNNPSGSNVANTADLTGYNTLYTIYTMSVNYTKDAHITSISKTSDTCNIVCGRVNGPCNNTCNVTPPTASPEIGYSADLWKNLTTSEYTSISDPISVTTNNTTYQAISHHIQYSFRRDSDFNFVNISSFSNVQSQGVTMSYSKTATQVTLNGSWTGGHHINIGETLLSDLGVSFNSNHMDAQFMLHVRYVSGSYTTTDNNVGKVTLQLYTTQDGDYTNIEFPTSGEHESVLFLDSNAELATTKFKYWLSKSGQDSTPITFDNYKIQFWVTQITEDFYYYGDSLRTVIKDNPTIFEMGGKTLTKFTKNKNCGGDVYYVRSGNTMVAQRTFDKTTFIQVFGCWE